MAYPEECCGVLIGDMDELKIDKICSLENSSEQSKRGDRFIIDPGEIINVEKNLEKDTESIIGIYHSHPDAEAVLSREDEENMIPGMLYIVLSIVDEKCRNIRAYLKTEPDKEATSLKLNYVR
ncbi:MAG: M67 family metallopeptidase [Lachnospiraceae bacterium]|nr:M67 family metallopeptidase [Lachnospiraceae bacterium]